MNKRQLKRQFKRAIRCMTKNDFIGCYSWLLGCDDNGRDYYLVLGFTKYDDSIKDKKGGCENMSKYYLENGVTVDVFGYDKTTGKYDYTITDGWSYKLRTAKEHYKSPDKRNEWLFPFGAFIYVILPNGKKQRLFIN